MVGRIFVVFIMLMSVIGGRAVELPTISPTMTIITADGEEGGSVTYSGSAPINVSFFANSGNIDGWIRHYEWRFYLGSRNSAPYMVRYDENTSYSFLTAGTHYVELYATFINGGDTVTYTQEYWNDAEPLSVMVSESKLELPNAFSPNGDGINDVYKVKDGYQSIVEFEAHIFNRWGQKLYSWYDIRGGWDGKYKGKDVAQGVYFCLLKARGADGKVYDVKRDVNLLRGYTRN